MVWLEAPRARVRVNFGQAPFEFDFVDTLPTGWVDRMNQVLRVVAAIARVTCRPFSLAIECVFPRLCRTYTYTHALRLPFSHTLSISQSLCCDE